MAVNHAAGRRNNRQEKLPLFATLRWSAVLLETCSVRCKGKFAYILASQ
jgi:hypothetical protein